MARSMVCVVVALAGAIGCSADGTTTSEPSPEGSSGDPNPTTDGGDSPGVPGTGLSGTTSGVPNPGYPCPTGGEPRRRTGRA